MLEQRYTHILTIEDSEQIRKIFKITLKARAYEVIEAATGKEGLEKLGQYPVDLVILDLGLPDADGLDILRRLRAVSDVPVIILTVRNDNQTRKLALEMGASHYLTKPFNPLELIEHIDRLVGQNV